MTAEAKVTSRKLQSATERIVAITGVQRVCPCKCMHMRYLLCACLCALVCMSSCVRVRTRLSVHALILLC